MERNKSSAYLIKAGKLELAGDKKREGNQFPLLNCLTNLKEAS